MSGKRFRVVAVLSDGTYWEDRGALGRYHGRTWDRRSRAERAAEALNVGLLGTRDLKSVYFAVVDGDNVEV